MRITTFVIAYFTAVVLCATVTLACTAWLLVEGAPWWGSLLELACGTAITMNLIVAKMTVREQEASR